MKKMPIFHILTIFTFLAGSFGSMPVGVAELTLPFAALPKPGTMVNLSPAFSPSRLQGMVIHPEDALKFDFLVRKGDQNLDETKKKQEYTQLVKYFLAALTVPDKDQWVNLSPYEKDRIIEDNFGKTEMGRDLLAQDYLLKQITSSLMYPESGLGKNFWDKVYKRAHDEFGTTNIPVNTFNKVWIVPDTALIYESGNTAYVVKSHLRVMLEEDYLSLDKHTAIENLDPNQTALHSVSSKVIREVILPELEREVNEGKNFAMLRQVYSGMLLATWYKHALKESLLGKVYADKAKVVGVNQDPKNNEAIYQQYLVAFKKGVYNYIKEDTDTFTNQIIPRKYFAGGYVNPGMRAVNVQKVNFETLAGAANPQSDDAMTVRADPAQAPKLLVALTARNYLFRQIHDFYKALVTTSFGGASIPGEQDQLALAVQILPVILSKKILRGEIKKSYTRLFELTEDSEAASILTLAVVVGTVEHWEGVTKVISNYKYLKEKGISKDDRVLAYLLLATVLNNTGDINKDLDGVRKDYLNFREMREDLDEKVAAKLAVGLALRRQMKLDENVQQALKEVFSLFVKYTTPALEPGVYDNESASTLVVAEQIAISLKLNSHDIQFVYRVFYDFGSLRKPSVLATLTLIYFWRKLIDVRSDVASRAMSAALSKRTNEGNANPAMADFIKGGIDMNSANLAMVIKRDGKGVPLPLALQDMAQLGQIKGFVGVILEIRPATALPAFSETPHDSQPAV